MILTALKYPDMKMSARSRGLLVKGGFYSYVERVILPDYSNSNMQFYSPKNDLSELSVKDYLKLFPNPAGDYIIAYYDLEDNGDVVQIIIVSTHFFPQIKFKQISFLFSFS